MFTGFTQETSDWFWELQFHNERPWFLAHKPQFERAVRAPFTALAEETFERFLSFAPKGRDWILHISRIYRDARIPSVRGPYKDHLWFSIEEGRAVAGVPSFWFAISADRFERGAGFWSASPAQMQRYRARIDTDPAGFEAILRAMTADGRFTQYEEPYKRPKGDRGAFLNPWYNCKRPGTGYCRPFGGEALSPQLPQRLAEDYRLLLPYYEFLRVLREEGETR